MISENSTSCFFFITLRIRKSIEDKPIHVEASITSGSVSQCTKKNSLPQLWYVLVQVLKLKRDVIWQGRSTLDRGHGCWKQRKEMVFGP